MHILHVISSIDADDGGPPVVATRLAAAQAAHGHDVALLTYDRGRGRAFWDETLALLPAAKDVEARFLTAGGRLESVRAPAGRAAVREMASRADVVHVHNVWEPFCSVAAAEARRAGRPYVLTPHSGLLPWSFDHGGPKKKLALALLFRRMLNDAAFILIGVPEEGVLLPSLGITAETALVPSGVSLEEIDPLPDPATFRAARPEIGDHPFVLFMSLLGRKKGLDRLGAAFAVFARSNDEVHLVVAGPDGGAREEFVAGLDAAGVRDRVHLVGPLYGRERFEALAACDCFCLPGRDEGFGVAITEALACARPVVLTPQCHRPEIGAAGAGEIVAPEPDALAGALARVMSDAERRAEMGRAGRALVEPALTWPTIAQETLALYDRAIIGIRQQPAKQTRRGRGRPRGVVQPPSNQREEGTSPC